MVVGYALGNRNNEEQDIQIIGEDDPDCLTYSKAISITLSGPAVFGSALTTYQTRDNLVVPYSTIKVAKSARAMGAREILYKSVERPDLKAHVRSTLELWGFNSYIEYLYTVCELGFLEGLIPVINLGFLTPDEIRKLSEVAALIEIPIEFMEDVVQESLKKDPKKDRIERRKSNLEWAGKLGFPTVTGFVVGREKNNKNYEKWLEYIAKIHDTYGMIHDVILQNFVPLNNLDASMGRVPTEAHMLEVYKMAKAILPPSINVVVPFELNPNIEPFIKAGMKDLGRIIEARNAVTKVKSKIDWEGLNKLCDKYGLRMQQRFPLGKNFIQKEAFSKKLGQVFEPYRYKIKRELTEKPKGN